MGTRQQEILAFAMARERASADSYRRWAARVNQEEVRSLLEQLAKEEDQHLERLSLMAVESLLAAPPPPPDFQLSEGISSIEPSEDLTLLETLQWAIHREVISIELYERLRKYGGDSAPLFASLADEERRHKHTLEERYARATRGLD